MRGSRVLPRLPANISAADKLKPQCSEDARRKIIADVITAFSNVTYPYHWDFKAAVAKMRDEGQPPYAMSKRKQWNNIMKADIQVQNSGFIHYLYPRGIRYYTPAYIKIILGEAESPDPEGSYASALFYELMDRTSFVIFRTSEAERQALIAFTKYCLEHSIICMHPWRFPNAADLMHAIAYLEIGSREAYEVVGASLHTPAGSLGWHYTGATAPLTYTGEHPLEGTWQVLHAEHSGSIQRYRQVRVRAEGQ